MINIKIIIITICMQYFRYGYNLYVIIPASCCRNYIPIKIRM